MDVGVAKPGRDGPTAELDQTGARPHDGPDVPVAAHGHDAAAAHGEGLGPRPRGIGGEDPSPGQHEVGVDIIRHDPEDDRQESCGRRRCVGCAYRQRAVIARTLTEPGHEGHAYVPTGPEALTYDECAGISNAVGRSIRYADPVVWSYWRRMRAGGMPRAMVGVTLGIYTAARLGLAADLTDDVARVTGSQPRRFADFAHDARAAWIPAPIARNQAGCLPAPPGCVLYAAVDARTRGARRRR